MYYNFNLTCRLSGQVIVALTDMNILSNDPEATDILYRNIHEDLPWLVPARKHVNELYEVTQDILDKKFSKQIKHNFQACYAEMYFAATLRDRISINVTHPSDKGPDFYLDQFSCWLEVVASSDGKDGNPNTIPKIDYNGDYSYPEDKVILRLSSVFKAKAEKLEKDICKGIINYSDLIVICISGGGMSENLPMDDGGFHQIIKALFPVGNMNYLIDRSSKEITGRKFEYRDSISKITDSGEMPIETNFFLNEKYSHVSAVVYSWANAANPTDRENWGRDFYIIHNPLAKNPLPKKLICCGREYVVTATERSFTIGPVFYHEDS